MRKEILISIIVFIFVFYPGCTRDSAEKKAAKIEQEKNQEQKIMDNRVILRIDNNTFCNRDLKNYIRINYTNVTETNKNLRLLSRIFDSFVEQKISLSAAELADIPISEEEYNQYVFGLNIRKEQIDHDSIINSLKLQKHLDANVYRDIDVSREEIREYYNVNQEEFTKKREILLYQIFLKDKEKALNISSLLDKNPEKFDEFARIYSESIETKNGGLLGYFEKGVLPQEMEDVVFSLKLNVISPVTESPYGFHIFKVTEQKKSGRTLYIKNVEAEIKEKILSEKQRKAYLDFLNKLKSQLKIDIKTGELYFKYQAVKGENKDEILPKNTVGSVNISSSQ